MRDWSPDRIASAARARILSPGGASRARIPSPGGATTGPERVVIDSRQAGPGALFVGLPGASHDGGAFAAQALTAGAWGV
ncbi:MAG TPA: Mur ligase domain-containing protein, partial [Solirubrobacteraceae bacterium]